jgi:hypothetical protein
VLNELPLIKQPRAIYNNLQENVGVDIVRDPVQVIQQGLNRGGMLTPITPEPQTP